MLFLIYMPRRSIKLKIEWIGPGGWINIKMPSYQYRKSHCGNKTILWPSYLHNGISYTGKTTSLCWIGAQLLWVYSASNSLGPWQECPGWMGRPCWANDHANEHLWAKVVSTETEMKLDPIIFLQKVGKQMSAFWLQRAWHCQILGCL